MTPKGPPSMPGQINRTLILGSFTSFMVRPSASLNLANAAGRIVSVPRHLLRGDSRQPCLT
jgi:hypothetical protein